jgi:hypothetical protein
MATQMTEPSIERIHVLKEIVIGAPPQIAFAALLEQLGPGGSRPDGQAMPMVIEPWPGGRWYRDLGNNAGHHWGHVQVIKPPTLLEICGPLFLSFPAMNHVQYRVTSEQDGSRLTLTHRAFGQIPAEVREGVDGGWNHVLERVREIALLRQNPR